MANLTAWGFINMADLFAQRVLEVGIQRVYDAVNESAIEYTRVLDALMSDWVELTTVAQEQFELSGSGTLQPLDAQGNPLPVLPSGSYQVAFPIQGGGTAWGTDRVSRAYLTVEEANRFTVDAQQRDKDWMMRHIIASLLTNVTWTYLDEVGANGNKGLGSITIQPLANADAVLYKRTGTGAPATDTHFLAQAAVISTAANPFPTIKTELTEHPSNRNGRVIAYVASNLVPAIKGIATFIGVDEADVTPAPSIARLSNVPDPGVGSAVIGNVDGVWIVEWATLPDDYLIAKVEGIPVVAMREHVPAELRGFFPESFSPDGNRLINRMLRYAGFGVRRRVAAVVMRIGNASYAVPTGWLAPLPV